MSADRIEQATYGGFTAAEVDDVIKAQVMKSDATNVLIKYT
jgi:hypothetical protein